MIVKAFGKKIVLALILCAFLGRAEGAEDRIRVGVLKFESKASGVADRQAEIITDIFTRSLYSSKKIAVYERVKLDEIGAEQRLGMSGLVDVGTAVEVGRLAGLQYIILGSVTELSERASGAVVPIFRLGAGVAAGDHEATARIEMRVIDVATSEIKLALGESGMSKNSAGGFTVLGATWGEAEFGGLEARAISDASSRLAHRIRVELAGEYSYVVSAEGSDFVIDQGAEMGVQEGAMYLVYGEGRQIRGMGGESLGRDKIPLAALKVKRAESGHSVCVVAAPSKGSVILRGDKIEPISAAEAKKIKFPSKRPNLPKTSDALEQVLESGEGNATQTLEETAIEPVTQPSSNASEPSSPALEGFDPNTSTDAKVIGTYPLSAHEKNALGIKYRAAWNIYSKKRYKDALAAFAGLTEEYGGDYLSAYWAGMSALKLKKPADAQKWFDLALEINPSYQPAIDAKAESSKKR